MEEGMKRKKTEEKTATENKESYAKSVPKDLPRAVLPDSILTIDVDAHVESFQEKEGREVACNLKRAQDKENLIRGTGGKMPTP